MTTPMTSPGVFFSFPRLTDPGRRADYDAWHLHDHLPENRALPGVVHGERWVRSPDCAAVSTAPDPLLAGVDDLAMYWFAAPLAESVAEWKQLGDSTLQEGRRPDLAYVQRPLLGMFRPIRAYLSPGTRVSAAALPFLPHRGVHVTVTAIQDDRSAAAHEQFQWHDRERLPRMVGLPGAAGAWSFVSEQLSVGSMAGGPAPELPRVRISLVWLEADPVEFARRLAEAERDWVRQAPPPAPDAERTLASGPLRVVVAAEQG